MNVLNAIVVEDAAQVAERIVELISSHAVQVIGQYADEDGALAACDRNRIDIAIVDLQLAAGTGFGVIRKLREPGRPVCSIVVLTNHAVPALKVAAFEAGADYFLDKSRDFATLPRLMHELTAEKINA